MRSFFNEDEFNEALKNEILPKNRQERVRGSFYTENGNWSIFTDEYPTENARGTVFIVHGFSENADKYAELIYYLRREGFSVVCYDQRGHGRSQRQSNNLKVTHVGRFEEYVDDLEAVIDHFSDTVTPPFYLFGHSMGGAVAMRYMEKHPERIHRAVLSAPMISIDEKRLRHFCSSTACRLLCCLGLGKVRVPFIGKDYKNEPFETSAALSPARFAHILSVRRQNPLLTGGAPTFRWSLEALRVTKRLLATGVPERVQTPVKIYSAEREHLVGRATQMELADRLPQGEFQLVVGSKHEILFANDAILHPVLEDMLNFFEK